MKITRNKGGTVTVRIPKVPEVYDQADGGLYIEETVTDAEFRAAIPKSQAKPKAKAKAKTEPKA